ncbi:MAG: hypothetical protein J4415_02180 [Candidatus Diapherotrites archaeon]|uniref:Uncharacterized protein n=1 Tax=Candidatus Iainarchaeum sp. TaxID=3101447 RepID=A0A8T4KV56_9ARCH|nr:hypothetical protein [Candidatus Diapherotrites archaeon]
MDTFTFLIAVILIMIAMQYNQTWVIFGAVGILILSMRSLTTIVMLIITVLVLFAIKGTNMTAYWPFIVFGLVILSLAMGLGKKPEQPEYYAPDLMGGLGGLGGGEGM